MNEPEIIVSGALFALAVFDAARVRGYMAPSRSTLAEADEAEWPAATIVLAVRGADASLEGCVRGILSQRYPRFSVRIVLDSRGDPAWDVVDRVAREAGATNIHLSPLEERRPTCSLKCSALLQAVAGLDPACEVVAFIDADVIPHGDWLRDLVRPLADRRVGATTGSRWHLPASRRWGSLVRSLWSAGAAVQMRFFGIPWGGSLAIRTEVLRRSHLLEWWGRALFEDTLVDRAVREVGLELVVVPGLVMVNREECELGSAARWIGRQLLDARLYHRGWWGVAGHSLGMMALLGAGLFLFGHALAAERWTAAAWAAIGPLVFTATMLVAFRFLGRHVQRAVRARGEEPAIVFPPEALLAVPLTEAVHAVGVVSALLRRTVEWRGVIYEVRGPFDVRLVEERPAAPAREPSAAESSG